MASSEHVTFRPGELADKLAASLLAPGSTAKRDLGRYYHLTELLFQEWWDGSQMWEGPWAVVVRMVSTRDWLLPPHRDDFLEHAKAFVRSPMALDFPAPQRIEAYQALAAADHEEVIAILDVAEREYATATQAAQAAATGGATSAAGTAPPA